MTDAGPTQGMPNWMIRGGIFSWMPFVMRDMAFSEAQRALLMGACEAPLPRRLPPLPRLLTPHPLPGRTGAGFPGYAFAQVPAAALIMRIGAKKVMGLNLLGTCGAYLLLPFAAALGPTTAAKAYLMAGCLAVAGFCQAPLVPGQKTVQRNWLPPIGSASRPIHHKLVSLGELFGQGILANVSTATVVCHR